MAPPMRPEAAPPGRPTRRRERGVVLIALLIMLVLVGVGALAAGEVWSTAVRREREVELMFVGNQYRHAIEDYYRQPGTRAILPTTVDQLLNDDRFPFPVHHLRRAYLDPVNPDGEWELIKVNNALVGVHSRSESVPIKHANFPKPYKQFETAETYAQWQFIFTPVLGPNRTTPVVPPPGQSTSGVPGFGGPNFGSGPLHP